MTTTLYTLYTLYSLNCGQVPTTQYNPGVTVKPAFSSGCMTRDTNCLNLQHGARDWRLLQSADMILHAGSCDNHKIVHYLTLLAEQERYLDSLDNYIFEIM